jgi:hypothetical protein
LMGAEAGSIISCCEQCCYKHGYAGVSSKLTLILLSIYSKVV